MQSDSQKSIQVVMKHLILNRFKMRAINQDTINTDKKF